MTKVWDILKYHFWIIPVIAKLLILFYVVEYIYIPHYLLKLLLCKIIADFTESACDNPVPSSFFFFSFGCLWICNLRNAWQYRLTVDIISGSMMKWNISTLNLYSIKKFFLLGTLYLFMCYFYLNWNTPQPSHLSHFENHNWNMDQNPINYLISTNTQVGGKNYLWNKTHYYIALEEVQIAINLVEVLSVPPYNLSPNLSIKPF
jgi:hypothetical protein